MLVLTRKLNEQIQIGNDITITIVRVKGNTVRVGIEAPRDVRIIRAELPEAADVDSNTQAADRDGAPIQSVPVANRSADNNDDDQNRRGRPRSPKGSGPLKQVMKEQSSRKLETQNNFAQTQAQHGDATSDAAIASLRLKPRRRAPGEKPAVLPRLPRLGPASPYTNRLVAYDQVSVLLE